MINVIAPFAILAVVMGVRVWLSRFIDTDHELRDVWRRR